MILPLLLLAADPETAIDAERAFNAAAQKGQWKAFRKFMTNDAVVFTPQPQKAKDALPTREPPIAVQWWPADSYISCDGNVAVNTGPWVRPKGVGYFTTVWVRQPDGHFKWVMDGGDALAAPISLPDPPRVHKASCKGGPVETIAVTSGAKVGSGNSADFTLHWHWVVASDGARTFDVLLWNGRKYELALHQEIAADK